MDGFLLAQSRFPMILWAACFCRRRNFRYPLDGRFVFSVGIFSFLIVIAIDSCVLGTTLYKDY